MFYMKRQAVAKKFATAHSIADFRYYIINPPFTFKIVPVM